MRWQLGPCLGKGAFAEVFQGIDTETGNTHTHTHTHIAHTIWMVTAYIHMYTHIYTCFAAVYLYEQVRSTCLCAHMCSYVRTCVLIYAHMCSYVRIYVFLFTHIYSRICAHIRCICAYISVLKGVEQIYTPCCSYCYVYMFYIYMFYIYVLPPPSEYTLLLLLLCYTPFCSAYCYVCAAISLLRRSK